MDAYVSFALSPLPAVRLVPAVPRRLSLLGMCLKLLPTLENDLIQRLRLKGPGLFLSLSAPSPGSPSHSRLQLAPWDYPAVAPLPMVRTYLHSRLTGITFGLALPKLRIL